MDGLGWLRRFSPLAKRLRVDVELNSEEARAYVTARGAEAALLGPLDDDGYVIYFRSETPTASAVLEEFAHLLQARRRRFISLQAQEMALRREIEVHECLERQALPWELPQAEREQTHELLVRDRESLARMAAWD